MLGRIMAGSQAVIAITKRARPSSWPIIHLTCICLRSSFQTVSRPPWRTGSTFLSLTGPSMRWRWPAFDAQGSGLLRMLDDNEHDGLDSFDTTEVRTLETAPRSIAAMASAPPSRPPSLCDCRAR